MMTDAVKLGELRDLPAVVDLETAARALGIGRTKAYELAKHGEFPCRLRRIGNTYRVPTAELLRYLGIEPVPGA
jgi:excisionase family DNA binding protein